MAVVIVPNAFLVTCSGTVMSKPWANVFGVRSGPNGASGGFFMTLAAAQSIADQFRTFYASQAANLTTQWNMQKVVVSDLQSATAPSFEPTIVQVTGTATGDAMPPHAALCVSHQTGFRGRSYRGRTYLAGFTEGANTVNGEILLATRTSVLTSFTNLRTNLAGISSGGFSQAVVSRALGNAFTVVSSTADPDWDRQDRRKR